MYLLLVSYDITYFTSPKWNLSISIPGKGYLYFIDTIQSMRLIDFLEMYCIHSHSWLTPLEWLSTVVKCSDFLFFFLSWLWLWISVCGGVVVIVLFSVYTNIHIHIYINPWWENRWVRSKYTVQNSQRTNQNRKKMQHVFYWIIISYASSLDDIQITNFFPVVIWVWWTLKQSEAVLMGTGVDQHFYDQILHHRKQTFLNGIPLTKSVRSKRNTV